MFKKVNLFIKFFRFCAMSNMQSQIMTYKQNHRLEQNAHLPQRKRSRVQGVKND